MAVVKINWDNVCDQRFPLPKPTMYYVMQNRSFVVFDKLSQTCKYFFAKCPAVIVRSFVTAGIVRALEIKQRDIEFPSEHPKKNEYWQRLNNLWITQELWILDWPKPSEIISKIYKCDASRLELGCNLTVTEFEFLIKSGNVKDLSLHHSQIFYPNYVAVPVEEIFSFVPNAWKVL